MTNKSVKFHKNVFGQNNKSGGAAFEYILVSIFGLLLSVAAIGFLSKAMKSKLSQLEEKLGIELDLSEINLIGGDTN